MDVETDVEQIIQQAQQKQRSTATSATQRRLARERQKKHRSRVAEESVQVERDQHAAESWNSRRNALKVVSLFETAPNVFCKDVHEQLHQARLFARRLIVRPQLHAGDSYRSYFSRLLETWCSPRWRCAGRSIARDELIYNVRFNYRKEDIEQLVAEMCVGADPDTLIGVANLQPLKWTVVASTKPAEPIDAKIAAHHACLDELRREELAVRAGKFSVLDDGNSFLLKPDGSETGWRYPRTFPSQQIHTNWNLLALAHRYLQANPDNERFCPEVRARIARVYEFRLQSTKTNFNRGMEEVQ